MRRKGPHYNKFNQNCGESLPYKNLLSTTYKSQNNGYFYPILKHASILLFCLLVGGGAPIFAEQSATQKQPEKKEVKITIQFSGIVLDQDSLTPFPFVAVMIKGTNWGTKATTTVFNLVVSLAMKLSSFHWCTKHAAIKFADTWGKSITMPFQVLTKDTVQLQLVGSVSSPKRGI